MVSELDAWVAYFQLLQDIAAEVGLDNTRDEEAGILKSNTVHNDSNCGGESREEA